MSTLNDYFLKHRTAGLRDLADRAGTNVTYLLRLNYCPEKRPSFEMAKRIVEASEGEITFEGLANPKKTLVIDEERRNKEPAAG